MHPGGYSSAVPRDDHHFGGVDGRAPHTRSCRVTSRRGLRPLPFGGRRCRGRLHPGTGRCRSVTLRDQHLRGRGQGCLDRGRGPPFLIAEHLEGVRLRPGMRRRGTRGGTSKARSQCHRTGLQLGHGHRAEQGSHHESPCQRRSPGHHQPGATRHQRGKVGVHPRGAVTVRRPPTRPRRGALRLGVRDQPAKPGHRAPPRELRSAVRGPR